LEEGNDITAEMVAAWDAERLHGSGIIHGHIVIDGHLEPVQIKNVHHIPDIPHTLISPLQLEDNGLDLQWRCGYGIKFYQGTRLRLYTIRCSWHIILPIYLDLVDSVAVAQMPPAGAPVAMLAADLDLIHHYLGHACEAMCHTHLPGVTLVTQGKQGTLLYVLTFIIF